MGNYLISCVMAGVTASLRFPGKLNGDLRKLGVNLVPFPRLHFFLISQAPLASKDNTSYQLVNVQELVNQVYSPRNFYSNVKPDDGKYMTASLIFRGPMSTQFGAMYKRKAFLHWYKGEGMDEMEFQEADKNVRDLITEYQDKQDATIEEDDEE